MGKAIKDKVETPTVEEIKNVEVPENAEEITEAEAEELKAKAEEQNQPIIEEPAPEVEKPKEEPKAEKEEPKAEKEEPKAEKEEGEWLVETPNPSYTGLNVTIEFKNGKGTTKNKVVAEHFEAKGYKVTKL